jgi:hypothetical protein
MVNASALDGQLTDVLANTGAIVLSAVGEPAAIRRDADGGDSANGRADGSTGTPADGSAAG